MERASSAADRVALVEKHVNHSRPADKTVDPAEYVEILRQAARARNGWKVILERWAPRCPGRLSAGVRKLDRHGYVALPAVFSRGDVQRMSDELSARVDAARSVGVQRSRGDVYAARNLLDIWPVVVEVLRTPTLADAIQKVLGRQYGVVRGLYFDKPPGRSWALPWHRDVTIAVKNNTLPTKVFTKPTTKTGVPHVEASVGLLQQMLTVRIHLDPVTVENGPMIVVPGSHLVGKDGGAHAEPAGRDLLLDAGDVLLIRPLVLHRSTKSTAGSKLHRRVIHLELAPDVDLPDGYIWHQWVWSGMQR